ncbi:MAG: hypothetical protein IH934_08160 [Nanoarchaeota archaeon]|nr:hypothetical protein [Nanoarchaeota archaeon]
MDKHVKRMYPNWRHPQEEESFYSKRIRALLVEDGALSYEEEGFMEGYEEGIPQEEEDAWWLDEQHSEEVV